MLANSLNSPTIQCIETCAGGLAQGLQLGGIFRLACSSSAGTLVVCFLGYEELLGRDSVRDVTDIAPHR